MVGLCRAWQVVVSLGKHTQDRTMLGLACHHRPWKAYMVGQCQAWHIIIALGQHTRSDYVVYGMLSSPFDNTHNQMKSSVTCH